MCINNTVVTIDSDMVDSLLDLGVNSNYTDRVSFRKEKKCAPIALDGFVEYFNGSTLPQDVAQVFTSNLQFPENPQGLQGHSFTAFYCRRVSAKSMEPTFVFNNASFGVSTNEYTVPYRVHKEVNEPGVLKPIPPLHRPNAAVTLFFLQARTGYLTPVEDPWFYAPVTSQSHLAGDSQVPVYLTQRQASVLGCEEQTHLCNPSMAKGDNCVRLLSRCSTNAPCPTHVVDDLSTELRLSMQQRNVLSRFLDAIQVGIGESMRYKPDGGLLASRLVTNQVLFGLSNNQWTLELQNWFAMQLVAIQLQVAQYVTGPDNPAYHKYITPPARNATWMCTNQIVQRNDYASFSVLSLAIIFIVGGLLIITNLSLSTIWPRIRRKTALNHYRDAQWDANELLELQRAASANTHEITANRDVGANANLGSTIKAETPSKPNRSWYSVWKKASTTTLPEQDSDTASFLSTHASETERP